MKQRLPRIASFFTQVQKLPGYLKGRGGAEQSSFRVYLALKWLPPVPKDKLAGIVTRFLKVVLNCEHLGAISCCNYGTECFLLLSNFWITFFSEYKFFRLLLILDILILTKILIYFKSFLIQIISDICRFIFQEFYEVLRMTENYSDL